MAAKQFKRIAPTSEALRQVATDAGRTLPPAQVAATNGRRVLINVKIAESAAIALAERAKAAGLTQKQFICLALQEKGIPMDPIDLEDRTPRRRAA